MLERERRLPSGNPTVGKILFFEQSLNPDSDFFKFEDKEDSNFNEIEDLVQYKSPKYFQRNYDNLTVYKREHPFNASKNTIETGVIHSSRPILKIYDGDCTQYYPPNKQEHFKEVVITKNKLLKCSLSSLEFEHHNLFSMEHVLQRKLLNSFESYQKRIKDEKMIKLLEEFQENVKSIKDVRKLRKNWMQESKVQRKELKKLLDTWKVLKELRITQKYSSTQVKVIVPQENLDIIKEMDIFEEILVKLIKTRTKEENDTISERAKNELEKYLKNLKPKLRCHLAKTNETTTDVEDELEIERRKEVFSTKIYMKIFCDGIQVCRTKPVRLTDDFILDINELFLIQLTTDPEYLNLEIYEETNRSSKKKICNIELKIPQSEVFYDETEEKEVFFSENTLKIHKHSAVGSGISLNEFFKKMNFDLIETRSNKLYTTGKVVFRLGWQNLQIEKKDLPNRSRFDIENKWGTVDKDLLHRLLNNNEEMNLEDAWIVDYLNLETDDDDYFRINKSSFSGEDVIENNLRFQCLKLRDQHEIEFDGSEISNKVRQIPVAQLKNFKIRKSVKTETEDVDEFIQTGKRRLMQLYTNIFLICKGLRYNMSYQSVVDERWLSYFGQVLKISVRNFINQFRWRPKLYKPLPNLVKSPFHAQSTIETSHQKQHKIQIKIMNGKNIPERKLEENKLGVNAFLEVSYDGVFSQTSVQSGPNPIWNELVELPVNLNRVSEYLNKPITLDLFDRIQDSDNTRNYWIGEIKIPLPALCTGFNMCGLFKVRKPEVSFRHLLQDTSNSKFLRHNELTDTYIYLELRLISNIPSLEPNMGELPTNEIPQVKVHILNWEKEYSTSFPNKNVYGLVIDSIGKTNCVTRYLCILKRGRLFY
ncbi:hypothetical protein ABEB36_011157 [Hypothenemus hampei]|uniref:C2 domain-containing protein n=1 Tax=Hypothenemus hampei TaxID=57062 RepID=A0ABD1EED7_HYPHA